MCIILKFSAFYSHFQVTSGQMTSLPCHFRSLEARNIISCHVTASSNELQLCRKWNLQNTSVFGLVEQLPNDLRSNDDTSGSLPVSWGHVTSFSGMWRHFPSRDCLLLRATSLYKVKCTVYASFRPSTTTSMWLLVKWRPFRVTSCHLRSLDIISYRVTASSCELQPSRKWNVQYTRVYGLLQPLQVTSGQMTSVPGHFRSPEVAWPHFLSRDCLPLRATRLKEVKCTVHAIFGLLQPLSGDFRSNDVTSGSLPVTWGHVTSFLVTCLPSPASCSLVGSGMYSIRQFLSLHSHFQLTSGQMTSLPGLFRSPVATWTSFPVTWLPPPAIYRLVGNEMYSIRQFSAFYSHFQETSGQLTYLPGHFRSPEVTCRHFCHMTASSCELQPCVKWNVQYTRVYGLLQPLPGNFRSNDVSSGSLPVTWGHVTSFPVTWLPPSASYKIEGSEMYRIREFSVFSSHF